MIQITATESSPAPAFFGADDTAVGLAYDDAFVATSFVIITDRGAMAPLLNFWAAAGTMGRFAFHGWEVEVLGGWQGQPGEFVRLLCEFGYLVSHEDRLRIAGNVPEVTRVASGLASVMDADLFMQASLAMALRERAGVAP